MRRQLTFLRTSLALLLTAVVLSACDFGGTPEHVDIPRIAEALRAGAPALRRGCDEGFSGFLQASGQLIAPLDGADRYEAALESYQSSGEGPRALQELSEPALFRLLLHRYGELCSAPTSASLARQLSALIAEGDEDGADGADGAESETSADVATRLRSLLASDGVLTGATISVDESSEANGRVVTVDLASSSAQESARPLVFLACLRCRVGSPVAGPQQIAAAVAAFEAVAASRIALQHPLRLMLCLDASRKPSTCRLGAREDDREVSAAIALDGTEPLVVAWSAEVSWHLELSHQPVTELWISTARQRATGPERGRSGRGTELFVVDAGATSSLDELPAEAWMELIHLRSSPAELAEWLTEQAGGLRQDRTDADYEVVVREERVRVTARCSARPAWLISERQSALWDLAALARSVRVSDPPRGAIAAMLRVVHRFDADPYGARLGLHYDDPIGGPLLVAPCSLSVREGNVLFALRMYRPPGLDRAAFAARLDDARARLRHAAGRPVVEAERDLNDPSRVQPDSDRVRLLQQVYAEVSSETLPEPTGSPRPGVGIVLPDAISMRLPDGAVHGTTEPSVALVTELIWQLSIATTEETREASSWD